MDKPDVDICACNRDNCNVAVDLGTRKCHQCSSEEKVFECENPDDEGNEVTCDGYCAIISYSKYQSSSLLWLLNTNALGVFLNLQNTRIKNTLIEDVLVQNYKENQLNLVAIIM